MASICRIEMLGGLRVHVQGRTITRFRTYKTGALLAYLACRMDRSHPREHLIDLLWPECEPELGRNSLSQCLSSLRHQLEPPDVPAGSVIVADRFSVRLSPDGVESDVAWLESALRSADEAREPSPSVVTRLSDAVGLYQGELLPGIYEEWCLDERDRIRALFTGAASHLIDHLERGGEMDRAIELARRVMAADPVAEDSHLRLMGLYAAAGQPGAAARQYRVLEETLRRELGTAPSTAARELVRSLSVPPPPPQEDRHKPESQGAVPPPVGIVTILVADDGGDTGFRGALARAVRQHGGQEAGGSGQAFCAMFARASDALAATVSAMRESGTPTARLALHTGEVSVTRLPDGRPGKRSALPVRDHALRILAAGNPGQMLCSEEAFALVRRDAAAEYRLRDLGRYRLRPADPPEALYEVEWPGSPRQEHPIPAAESASIGSLPQPITRFFGREVELDQIVRLLSPVSAAESVCRPSSSVGGPSPDLRLITLTGPGGAGKSRLSIEAGRRLLEAYRGAVWFVPLADVTNPRLAPAAIADTLRIPLRGTESAVDRICDTLSRQPSLLILDNLEQLLEPAHIADAGDGDTPLPSLVQLLLERVPGLHCLATSRRPLGIVGEHELAVAPLPSPGGPDEPDRLAQFASVQLLVDRAQAVRADYQVTPGNAQAVATLCARLEGMPLAIELAAGRCQALTTQQILDRLGDRLDFLANRRARDSRHRTLRAAIDWSYDLLQPEARTAFARLSVFRGGFGLEAAEAVLGETNTDALDLLCDLRECSLLNAQESGTEMRYGMLDSIRQYAAEKLAESGAQDAERSHAHYYLRMAESAEPNLWGPEQSVWLARLETEHDNLRAALQWAVASSEHATGLGLAGALWRFWSVRGHLREGREHLAAALELAESRAKQEGREPHLARAYYGAAQLAYAQSDYPAVDGLLARALPLYRAIGDDTGTARALNSSALVAFERGDYAVAASLYAQAQAICRATANRADLATALSGCGIVECERGNYAASRDWQEQALELRRELGDRSGIAASLNNLGIVARRLGEYEEAQGRFTECLEIRRANGDKRGEASAISNLALVADNLGRLDEALALYAQSLGIRQEIGDRWGIALTLHNQALIARRQGNGIRARELAEESLALRRKLGDRRGEAYALLTLSQISLDRADLDAARPALREGIGILREVQDKQGLCDSLDTAARLALALSHPGHAAALLNAAEDLRARIGAPIPPAEQADHEGLRADVHAALASAPDSAAPAPGLSADEALDAFLTIV